MIYGLQFVTRRLRRAVANFVAAIILLGSCFASVHAAEIVTIGTLKSIAVGPVYIAIEKGYFADEGLTPDLKFFDAPTPIAVAVVSKDLDFGVVGFSGGLFSLAGQGAIRVIGGYARDVPGFHFNAWLVSNSAYNAGLHSYKEFPGHSSAASQLGGPEHYGLALLAEKYRFDLDSVRLMPVSSLGNVSAALVGGKADVAFTIGALAIPIITRGEVKLLGWAGDETPWQVGGLFVATATANERSDVVARFLRAFKKGAREYHDAFTGPGETRKDGPTAGALLPIIAKYTGLSVDQIEEGIVYDDPEARLDVRDVLHQIAWYRGQGFVKGEVDGDRLIDKRYVIPLPEK